MRRRLQCKEKVQYGSKWNPCHKILAEVYGGDIIEGKEAIVIIDPEKIIFKCSSCGEKQTIEFKNKTEERKE